MLVDNINGHSDYGGPFCQDKFVQDIGWIDLLADPLPPTSNDPAFSALLTAALKVLDLVEGKEVRA